MSIDPSQGSDFGSHQFQKVQFGHKPHEEIKSDDAKEIIRERVSAPANILKLMALLAMLATFFGMLWSCGSLAANRNDYVGVWNANVLAEYRAERRRSVRPNATMTRDEEKAIKAQTDWNKNYFTLMIGARAVAFFFVLCLLAFIAVGAHNLTKLKSYGQGMTVSIMALIPVISPFGVLGIPIGIWLLKILLESDVKKAFR